MCLSAQYSLLAGWNTSLPPCAMAVENHLCENLPKHWQSAILSSSKNPKNGLAEVFCSILALQAHLADVDWCSSSQLKWWYVLQSACALCSTEWWHTALSKNEFKNHLPSLVLHLTQLAKIKQKPQSQEIVFKTKVIFHLPFYFKTSACTICRADWFSLLLLLAVVVS